MKAKNVPKVVSYTPVSEPDESAVFAAFDFLFKKTVDEIRETSCRKGNTINLNNIKGGDAKS